LLGITRAIWFGEDAEEAGLLGLRQWRRECHEAVNVLGAPTSAGGLLSPRTLTLGGIGRVVPLGDFFEHQDGVDVHHAWKRGRPHFHRIGLSTGLIGRFFLIFRQNRGGLWKTHRL
jgi:hypothetical protein